MYRVRSACTGLLKRPVAIARNWASIGVRDARLTWMSTVAAYGHRVVAFSEEASRQRQSGKEDKHEISVELYGCSVLKEQGFKPSSLFKDLELKRCDDSVTAVPLATAENPFVAALVNGHLVGLTDEIRVAEPSVNVEFLRFGDKLGKKVYWHSAAHILGAALEQMFGHSVKLCDGPALLEGEGGFFYEFALSDMALPPDAELFPALELIAKGIIKSKCAFERLQTSKEVASPLFADNNAKATIIQRLASTEPLSLYRSGDFVDLCRGPHVPHSGVFRAFHLYRAGGSHVGGKEFLHRIYGIAFPTAAQLTIWQKDIEAAKLRDHRVIGRAQHLFFFHDLSPGSAFLLPHGTRIYNKLTSLLRSEYAKRGYSEVMTPLLFKKELWKTSGHLDNYAEDMFAVLPGLHQQARSSDHDSEELGLKPMNCPGHCLMFAQRSFSYKELPIRYADFSSLHRNEATGALGGLTRLRRFQQDDAHIFCTEEQIQDEIFDCLDFVAMIYSLFGFSFRMKLSTRPVKFVGDLASWHDAEAALHNALSQYTKKHGASSSANHSIEIDEGGGAFYGPKIDVFIQDALGREHQCATLQLDFQLPKRFELQYQTLEGNYRTPVIIHRAIMGSLERFFGVLIEHTAGKWPFWLSPRQVIVCTVNDRNNDYAASCAAQLKQAEADSTQLYVDVDASQRTIPKKVRDAQVSQYNLIALVGDEEQTDGTLTLRFRDTATKQIFMDSWVGEFGSPPTSMDGSHAHLFRGPVEDIRAVLRGMQRDLK